MEKKSFFEYCLGKTGLVERESWKDGKINVDYGYVDNNGNYHYLGSCLQQERTPESLKRSLYEKMDEYQQDFADIWTFHREPIEEQFDIGKIRRRIEDRLRKDNGYIILEIARQLNVSLK